MNQFIQNLIDKGASIIEDEKKKESEETKRNIISWEHFKEEMITELNLDKFKEYIYTKYDLKPSYYKYGSINYYRPSNLYIIVPNYFPIMIELRRGDLGFSEISEWTLEELKDKKTYIWISDVGIFRLNGYGNGLLYSRCYWIHNDKNLCSKRNYTKEDIVESNSHCFDTAFYYAKEGEKNKKEVKKILEILKK